MFKGCFFYDCHISGTVPQAATAFYGQGGRPDFIEKKFF